MTVRKNAGRHVGRLAHAESAFLRALELDPVNSAAQCNAALVHACRYGGLLEESLAAHHQAQRLDPTVATTVHHTYYMQGDYDRALHEAHRSSDPFVSRVLWAMGRDAEALAAARREESRFVSFPLMRAFSTALRAALEDRRTEGLTALLPFEEFGFSDGEGLFCLGGIYATLEEPLRAHATLKRAVDGGFLCLPAFERDVFPAPLRGTATWHALLDGLKLKAGSSPTNSFVPADGLCWALDSPRN